MALRTVNFCNEVNGGRESRIQRFGTLRRAFGAVLGSIVERGVNGILPVFLYHPSERGFIRSGYAPPRHCRAFRLFGIFTTLPSGPGFSIAAVIAAPSWSLMSATASRARCA